LIDYVYSFVVCNRDFVVVFFQGKPTKTTLTHFLWQNSREHHSGSDFFFVSVILNVVNIFLSLCYPININTRHMKENYINTHIWFCFVHLEKKLNHILRHLRYHWYMYINERPPKWRRQQTTYCVCRYVHYIGTDLFVRDKIRLGDFLIIQIIQDHRLQIHNDFYRISFD
jgi:hypothetical protein